MFFMIQYKCKKKNNYIAVMAESEALFMKRLIIVMFMVLVMVFVGCNKTEYDKDANNGSVISTTTAVDSESAEMCMAYTVDEDVWKCVECGYIQNEAAQCKNPDIIVCIKCCGIGFFEEGTCDSCKGEGSWYCFGELIPYN